MCTVVLRWGPGQALRALALRDELVGREFDEPGAWWPDQPGVVGGRDRVAGGSWCVSDVASGVSALVLNRPERRLAAPGAPSRGVLPLRAVRYGSRWPEHVELAGMASFALLLAGPGGVTCWTFDGVVLGSQELAAGTHLVTSGGAEDARVPRHLPIFRAAGYPEGWEQVLRSSTPSARDDALVVRREVPGDEGRRVYATVFGAFLEATPGTLVLRWSRAPWGDAAWTTRRWPAVRS